jgi:hypothetical protein
MATDLERLIVTVEANTRQFTRAMNALSGTTERSMRSVETTLTRSGDRIGSAFGRSIQRSLISALSINFLRQSAETMGELGDKDGQAWSRTFDAALRAGQEGALGAFDQFYKEIKEKFETISRLSLTTDIGKQLIGQLAQMDISSIEQTIPGLLVKLARQSQAAVKQGVSGGLQSTVFAIHYPGLRTADFPGREVIQNLRQQQAEIGNTAKEQEVLNNVRQAGVDIDSKYGIVIAEATRRLYDQKQILDALKDANDALESSTKTFAQGLLDGQSAAESLNAALRQLASTLLDMAFKNLFNPGGTPLLQNLFGGSLGLPGASGSSRTASVSNTSLGVSGRMGNSAAPQFHTSINVQGSVDQKTLGAMKGMIERNNIRQNQELQRTWGNRQARYSALRGP